MALSLLVVGPLADPAIISRMGEHAAAVDIDHVSTVLDLAHSRQLFSALERLGLAAVWPFAEYPGFATGAARLGNLTLEAIGVDDAAAEGWPDLGGPS